MPLVQSSGVAASADVTIDEPSGDWLANPRAAWLFIALGTVLRLVQYLHNRSLWLDEAMLAINLVERSYRGLLRPLEYFQQAPAGFLLAEKGITQVIGAKEYSLRLLPLLFGIAGLVFTYRAGCVLLGRRAATLAVALLACSAPAIYYSSELKAYSSDGALTALLLWLFARLLTRPLTSAYTVLLTMVCFAAIWLSFPTTFVAAGAMLTLFAQWVAAKRWKDAAKLVIPGFASALAFAGVYFISVRPALQTPLARYFSYGYAPLRIRQLFGSFDWLLRHLIQMFENPGGLLAGAGVLCFAVGCVAMWKNRRAALYLIVSPIALCLLASYAQRYIFDGRFLMFLVPLFMLGIAEGAELIRQLAKRTAPVVGTILIVVLLLPPAFSGIWNALRRHGVQGEEMRASLQYVKAHSQPDDVWYVYRYARQQYRYYAEVYGLAGRNVVISTDESPNWDDWIAELDRLRGTPRLWIIFSHNWSGEGVDEERFFLHHLDKIGRRIDAHYETNSAAYLYDLSSPAPRR